MKKYAKVERYPVAVDCIIFGFDGREVKLLLIHRGFEPQRGKWSLMGGFVERNENLDDAAVRILRNLTGLQKVYMEQLFTFGHVSRDPVERTVSVVYYAMIDIRKYEDQLADRFRPAWFSFHQLPPLIFDHRKMVEMAREKLRFQATHSPILFELLPSKFTIPQLQTLYECVFNQKLDKRNFSRKLLSEGFLLKTTEKEKDTSRKGAYYFKLNKRNYDALFTTSHKFAFAQKY